MSSITGENYSSQERELYLKMELEKKEFRFKQLENDIKSQKDIPIPSLRNIEI